MFDGETGHIYGQPDDDCNQDYFIWPGGGLVGWFGLKVFNTTFNTISVISWLSVLLVEETGGPGENHRPVTSHSQALSHNVVHLALIEIRTHKSRVVEEVIEFRLRSSHHLREFVF